MWPAGFLRASEATHRAVLVVDGQPFSGWTRLMVTRQLSELSGSFQLEMRDPPRHLATFPYATPDFGGPIQFGKKCEILLDGEMILKGWIEDVHPYLENGRAHLSVAGRDVTCDAVDCPADPQGKHEYLKIDLLEGAKRTLAKFTELTVRAEVDVGKPFDRWTIEAGETALSTIEKYARKRAILVTSDGVGGVVLTRSGKTRAPGSIIVPGNAIRAGGNFSSRERFSHYFVKGGAEKGGGGYGSSGPALDAEAAPLAAPKQASGDQLGDSHAEAAGSLAMGLARDSQITRWRPFVSMSRTQTSNVDAQTFAEWLMRTRRGKSEQADYEQRGWRAESGGLWRLNEIVPVDDSFTQLDRDMLIHGISYQYSDRGDTTRLRVCGPEAYDRLPEEDRRQAKGSGNAGGKASAGGGKSGGKLDSTANTL